MLRVLLLADTHLGFDLPVRPRIERRRRGPDFFANTRLALDPDSVVQVRVDGDLEPGAETALRAENIRSLHPSSMTVDLRLKRSYR